MDIIAPHWQEARQAIGFRQKFACIVRMPVGVAFWVAYEEIRDTLCLRMREAKGTEPVEAVLFLYGLLVASQSILAPGGYTLGWNVASAIISQREHGCIVLGLVAWRFAAILSGRIAWRRSVSWAAILLGASTFGLTVMANPRAPTLPYILGGLILNTINLGQLGRAEARDASP